MLGEYVLNINSRILKRPLVVEETRLNFDGYELPNEYEVAGAKEKASEEKAEVAEETESTEVSIEENVAETESTDAGTEDGADVK